MKSPGRVASAGAGLLALAAFVLGPARATTAEPKTPEQIIKIWASGPARYLMTSSEYEEIKHLKTVPDLARFITAFWARRDPTPGTFENEYRRMYWSRVVEANRRFRDSTEPGWKTDRGKVFILLGEPDYIESDDNPKNTSPMQRLARGPGAPDSGERGIERWHYTRHLSRFSSPEFIVAFVRDESLLWKLSTNDELIQPVFPGLSTSSETDAGFGPMHALQNAQSSGGIAQPGLAAAGAQQAASAPPAPPRPFELPPLDSSVFANYDLGLELSAPSSAELIIASVNAREFLSAFAAQLRFEYFRAQDGSTFVNVGALVGAKDLYGDTTEGGSDLRVYASLAERGDPSHVRYSSNEKSPARIRFSDQPPPGGAVDTWTGLAVPPGAYVVTLAVEDSLTGRVGRASAEIEVPDFKGSRLSLSTLIPASSLSQKEGRLGVSTRASAVFRRSEEFGLYYEVYGLEPSGAGKRFEASYRFFREAESAITPIGKPIVFRDRTEGVQGWSFPLAKWPPGRYRIEVTVTAPGKEPVSSRLPFEIVD